MTNFLFRKKFVFLGGLILASCSDAKVTKTEAPPIIEKATSTYSEADEALYMERFTARASGKARGIAGYDPLKPVGGAATVVKIPAAKTNSISKEALSKASAYAKKMNSSSLIILRNDQIEFEAYYGDTTESSLLNSKSLAKPLSVLAVGRAIKEGHIASLDLSVSDFITEWKGTEKAKIKVRHLLDMRSGILPQAQAKDADDILNRAYLHPRHDDVIINDYPLVDEPGSRYEYANATSELVAPLIERATGKPYEDWVSNEILKPLGAAGGKVWMNRENGTPHSGCCILLPAESYLRFARLYLNDGMWDDTRLLPEGFINEATTPTPQNPHSAMGVYVAGKYVERRGPLNPEKKTGQNYHSEPYLADDLYLFDGNGHQTAYIIPSADLVILRTGEWSSKDEAEWDNSFLPNTILRGIKFPAGKAPTPQK